MITYMILYLSSYYEQDCVEVLAPYPNNQNPVESLKVKTNFDLQGDCLVWYEHSRLFFNCTLCPTSANSPLHSSMHKEMSLVYFIAFESIELTPDSIMQQAGVPMHYDQASNQCLPYLYICPVKNLLGSPPHSVLHH